MKKLKYIILSLICLIATACNDEFLERAPLGSLTAGNYPSTEIEAISATNGVYNTLRLWHINTGGFPLLDIMSDESRKGSNPGDGSQINLFDQFAFTASEGNIENWYRALYQGIRRAHLVMEKVPQIDMDEDLKNRLVAETRFLRAYFYSILARGFGDVPMVTSSETSSGLGKSPRQEIFDQIIFPDLEFAIDNLPEKSDYDADDLGRATKGSARALLARLYLFLGDFINTEKYALEVINSQQYDLETDFEDAFNVAGEHGVESVFEVGALPESNLNLGGNQYANTQGVRGTPNYGWGFNRPEHDWMLFMGGQDPRLDASIIFLNEVVDGVVISGDATTPDTTYTDATKTEILEIESYNQKAYASGDGAQAIWGHNRRIIRYSDVLLMAAEALNENGKTSMALDYLNEVRARARGGNNAILPDITTTNQAQLRQEIYDERSRELFLEGLRFWDLVRTNRAATVLGPKGFVQGKHEIFPIPQSEIDISDGAIVQDPRWNN
jgi:hypothetical protein